MHCRYFRCAALVVLISLTAFAQQQESVPIHFVDKKPPKYEYGYVVSDAEGSAQGHVHTRDGMYTLGRYYVNLPNGSAQKVTYFADHLGYHPLVSYESTSTKGSSRAQFAMGQKALAALSNTLETASRGGATRDNFVSTTLRPPPLTTTTTTTTTTSPPLASPTHASKFEQSFTTPGNFISTFGTKNFGSTATPHFEQGRHGKLLSKPSTVESFAQSTPPSFESGRVAKERPSTAQQFSQSSAQSFETGQFSSGRPSTVQQFAQSTSQSFETEQFSSGRPSTVQQFAQSTPQSFETGQFSSGRPSTVQFVQSTPQNFESERFSSGRPSTVQFVQSTPQIFETSQFSSGRPSTVQFVHSTSATPLFEQGGLTQLLTGPSTILSVVQTTPATAFTTSEPLRLSTQDEKEVKLITGLDQVLQFASEHIDKDLAKSVNESFNYNGIENVTAEASGVERNQFQNSENIVKLSPNLEPPSSDSYAEEIERIKQQLNEQQRLYAERLQALSPTSTTMRPIVVAEDSRFGSEVEQLNNLASINSITTINHGESGYNSVEQSGFFNGEVSSTTDSTSQSSNAVPINQPSNSIADVQDTGINNQLAALQAGISILSSESAKPVKENSIEVDSETYTTVVDIQKGISLDVQQNPDGSISLASNFGQRLRNQGQPQRFHGLAYERRLVSPLAQEIAREPDPVIRQQKQEELLLRQEAEIREVEKSIDVLQQQIITQIDREHEQEQRKHEQEERRSHLDNLEKVDALTRKGAEVTIENVPGQLVASTDVAESNEVPAAFAPQQDRLGNQIVPQRTVKSQNLAGVLTLHGKGNQRVIGQAPNFPPEQDLAGVLTISSGSNVPPSAETIVVQQGPQNLPVNYPIRQKQVPPITTSQSVSKPVLLEPYPLETEGSLLPASPPPTLFPVKLESPSVVETAKLVDIEKPPKEVTKVVQVEKPVPVLQPFPVEVTKFVHVDRPVPVPQPVAVSHPVPVPVAVPQAVGVPVPHLIPVPEILPVTLKEYYPVFVHKDNKPGSKPEQIAAGSTNPNIHIFGDDLKDGVKEIFLQSLKKPAGMVIQEQVQPEIAHTIEFEGDVFKHDFDLQSLITQHVRQLHLAEQGQTVADAPRLEIVSQNQNQGFRNKDALKNLRIEYGFKPPLRPSVQLTEEVKPSIYGPSVRS